MKKGLRTISTIAVLGVGVVGFAGYKAHSVRKDVIGYTNKLLQSEGMSIRPESQCNILIAHNTLNILCADNRGKVDTLTIPVETDVNGLGAEEVRSDSKGLLDPNSGILLIEGSSKVIKEKSRGISI